MRIQFIMAVAVSGLLSLPTVAEANPGRFMGGGTVFNLSQACRDVGWIGPSEPFSVRYHPSGVGTNRERDFIGFMSDYTALGYMRESGSFTNTFQPVTMSSVTSGAWSIPQNSPDAAQLRVTNINPRNVTEDTRGSVRIRGQIRNFSGVQNCNVRFDVIVSQRP